MTVMTGAQAIVASLEAEGVDLIFGYPGGRVLALYDALYHSEKIVHVLARHEQGAVHEADGFARATGKVGVAVVTSGPGATNTVTGIATAYMDSIPLVVFSGQVPRAVIGTDAFQESDIFGITLPIVKHSYMLKSAAEIPHVIKEAFTIAGTGRPGPVLIDVPSDVADEMCDFVYPETITIASYKPTVKGNARQIKQAALAIASSARPVILAGGGVISSGENACTALAELALTYNIPVVTTLMGIGAFPSSESLNLGFVGMHGTKAGAMALNECDCLIACGTRLSDRVTAKLDAFAPSAALIHIDIDPAEIGKRLAPAVPIVGDVGGVLRDIATMLAEKEDCRAALVSKAKWAEQTRAWVSAYPLMSAPSASGVSAGGYVSAMLALRMLSQKLDKEHTIVVTEVGQHQMWAAQLIARDFPRTFLSSGGLGTMGFGFPASIGAQYGRPDCSVICIAGDGSFLMNSQEMATAASFEVPVKVVLLNNHALGMVKQQQKRYCDARYSATILDNVPDYMKLADAYGWRFARVHASSQLAASFDTMLASKKPFLLEILISPDEEVVPMVGAGEALV